MKAKNARYRIIKDLIKSNSVGSQGELLQLLDERGCKVTQATLSRDLKDLKVSKVAVTGGKYVYILPNNDAIHDEMLSQGKVAVGELRPDRILSTEVSGNMVVIKTRNGYAQGLAYDIDMSRRREILGTISGADTIFLVLRNNLSKNEVAEILRTLE